MKNGWLILPKDNFNEQDIDTCQKLMNIMNQIDDGRGWRFTDEQAATLAKLVDNLFEQIKAYNKKRNKKPKRHIIPFLK